MTDRPTLRATDVLSKLISFPNDSADARLSLLVGLDEHIESLARDLRLIYDPQIARSWSQEHYGKDIPLLSLMRAAVPLIIFEGDVGTGKTELAETIAQRVAREAGYGIHLVKMSTRVRGTGYVGEMGTLLSESFQHVVGLWEKKGEPILFVIDEADSLLTSRDAQQHHHEDKSGVNTILQHLDALRDASAQIAVIAITNRLGVIDPAVRRRATSVLTFHRPNAEQRAALFARVFEGTNLSESDIEALVSASSEGRVHSGGPPISFSYSDLTLRFAVPAVREAIYGGVPLALEALLLALEALEPTPPMAQA